MNGIRVHDRIEHAKLIHCFDCRENRGAYQQGESDCGGTREAGMICGTAENRVLQIEGQQWRYAKTVRGSGFSHM